MIRIRVFEERIGELSARGEIKGPVHLCIGQEAVAVGVCAALGTEDYVFGGHRSHGHYLAKGGSLKELTAELFGRVSGCSGGRGGSMHLTQAEVGLIGTVPIVAATIPLAVGAAFASQLRGDRRVSVAFFGDGATEEGTFHEAMNFAALKRLPVLFVCENNSYSSHLALRERRAKDNIAESAGSYGMTSLTCDGNDAVHVFEAASSLVHGARAGEGPGFMECRTFRWRGHVGASWDLDVGLDRNVELEQWLKRDPITILSEHLPDFEGYEDEVRGFRVEAKEEVEDSIRLALASPQPDPADLMRFVFGEERSTDG